METQIFTGPNKSISVSWKLTCSRYGSGASEHSDRIEGSSSSYTISTIDLSGIPKNSTIESVILKYSVKKTSGDSGYWYNVRFTATDKINPGNDDIKDWLNKNKNEDGSFKNVSLKLYGGVNTSHTPSSSIGIPLIIQRTLAMKLSDVSLTVNYNLPYDSTKPSPSITSFSVKDNSKAEETYQIVSTIDSELPGKITTSAGKEKEIIATHNSIPVYNCLFPEKNNLTFTSNANTTQPTPTLTYDLIISYNGVKIYEQIDSLSPNFSIDWSIIEEKKEELAAITWEDGNGTEKTGSGWLYNFSYTVYDIGKKGTEVKGYFFLNNNYTLPTVDKFLVERINYIYNDNFTDDEDKYQAIIDNDGQYLLTSLELSTDLNVPIKITYDNENKKAIAKDFNRANYLIECINSDTDILVVSKKVEVASSKYTLPVDEKITLLSGEKK